MRTMMLPVSVKKIIELLNKAGHRADVVGGCVRDFLLGDTPNDYDITTSATPEEMKAVFSGYRTIETGIKHGTLTVLVDSVPYEITTHRQDGDYKDHRHPDSVSFSKRIEDDLSRRDFTMNAMAYNEVDGITDIFGGKEDIENRVIRAVGDPYKRFDEDALRILRAIRFSAKLGFSVDAQTARAARDKKALLSFVSGERIFTEWKKLLESIHAYSVVEEYKDIISEFLIPGIEIKMPTESGFDIGTPSLRQLSLIMLSSPDPLASFKKLSDRLHFDNETKKEGIALIENFSKVSFESEVNVKRALSTLSKKHTEAMIKLKMMLGEVDASAYALYTKVIESNDAYSVSALDVCGNDLISLGILGREVGIMLNRVLDAVITEKVKNNKMDILEYVKNLTGEK